MSDTDVKAKPEGYVFGRPTKYRKEMCEQVVAWGRDGKSKTWIAAELGIDRRTIDRWEVDHPDFCLALARAKALEQQWWEDAGQTGMKMQGFGQSIWSRSMAARFPDDWRETTKQENEVYGKGGGPVEFAQVLGKLTNNVCPVDDGEASEG